MILDHSKHISVLAELQVHEETWEVLTIGQHESNTKKEHSNIDQRKWKASVVSHLSSYLLSYHHVCQD